MATRKRAKRKSKSGTAGSGSGTYSDIPPVLPFREAVIALLRWFDRARLTGVVIGGVAVALLGRARQTRDLDALAVTAYDHDDWPFLFSSARETGFVPREADPVGFAQQTRMVLLRHVDTGIEVDVSIGLLPFEHEVIARATVVEVAGVRLPLPTPEDLIVMKAVAHRPQDLADIDTLLSINRGLDRRRIRRLVGAFAAALEMPEIVDGLENLLRKRR